MSMLERVIMVRPGARTYNLRELLEQVRLSAGLRLTGNLEPEALLALVSHAEQLAADLDTAIEQREEAQAACRMLAGNVRAAVADRPLAHDPLPMVSFLSDTKVAKVQFRQSCSCTAGILSADNPERAHALFEVHRTAVLHESRPLRMAEYPAPPQDGNGALLTEEK